MKYEKVEWPEIQEYMERPDYNSEVYYDSNRGVWFIPETWPDPYAGLSDKELKEIFEDMEADTYLSCGIW